MLFVLSLMRSSVVRSINNASNPKDKNLVSAFSFFISNIYDEMQHSKLSPTQFLLALRSAITDKLLYVDIMASSEEDACTIFEILNRNSPAKKISKKNFLPSVGHIMVAITRMIEIRNAFK